jgi:hypothetical protein
MLVIILFRKICLLVCENVKIKVYKYYDFACSFVWVLNLVSGIKEKT